MSNAVPVLLDTDIGSDIDDALCLAYLLAQPRCELLGVASVSGQPRRRAMLADALCRAAGRTHVPVWSGTGQPLLVEQRQPEAPQAQVLPRWAHRDDVAAGEAVWRMREVVRSRPGEVTLLTIGPLTNVALLFALDREVPRLLRRIVVMGGWFFRPGHAEWNMLCDPHAAAIAAAAEVPEAWFHGLDVTTRCRLPVEECRRRLRGGPLDAVANMAEVWFRSRDAITFHDPLAAACVFEPQLCGYRRGRARVILDPPQDAGRTELIESPGGPHHVAGDVSPDAFFEHYFATLERLK